MRRGWPRIRRGCHASAGVVASLLLRLPLGEKIVDRLTLRRTRAPGRQLGEREVVGERRERAQRGRELDGRTEGVGDRVDDLLAGGEARDRRLDKEEGADPRSLHRRRERE